MILTTKRHGEHPFASRNTQQYCIFTGQENFKIDEDSGELSWTTAFTLRSDCVIQDGNILLPVTVSQLRACSNADSISLNKTYLNRDFVVTPNENHSIIPI